MNKELSEIRALGASFLPFSERKTVIEKMVQSGAVPAFDSPKVPAEEALYELRQSLEKQGVTFLTYFDQRYPQSLKDSPIPPACIFVRGNCPKIWPRMFSIVGTRRACIDGVRITERLSKGLVERGISVVSGLALGIDAAAHRGALSVKGTTPTIGVLGCSVDLIYPPSHKGLADKIIQQGGCIISEYPPSTPAYPWNFLERNRIIAALSEVTIVVQAPARSGAMVTAYDAVAAGREVYSVPWSILDKRGEGTNQLLLEGAHPLTSVEGFLTLLGGVKKNDVGELGTKEAQIVSFLSQHGGTHPDTLSAHFGGPIDCEIMELELSGVLRRLPSGLLDLT